MPATFGIVIAIVAIVGAAPIVAGRLGWSFLPSVQWVETMQFPATVAGLVLGAATLAFLFLSRKTNPSITEAGWFKQGVIYLFVIPLMWFLTYAALLVGVPMGVAMVAGNDVRLAYTVADPDLGSQRSCRNKIDLADMPFAFDGLCGVPEGMAARLREGQTVYALGSGSAQGVFYDQFEW